MINRTIRSGVKRGVAGARLCDAVGCRNAYPCALHEPMRHSHGHWTAPLAVFTTDAKCPHGYSVCPCLLGKPAAFAAPAPPPCIYCRRKPCDCNPALTPRAAAKTFAVGDMVRCMFLTDQSGVVHREHGYKHWAEEMYVGSLYKIISIEPSGSLNFAVGSHYLPDRFERVEQHPAQASKPSADTLPDGWVHAPDGEFVQTYKHRSAAEVFESITKFATWKIQRLSGGELAPTSSGQFATRAEAMAASLGFEIVNTYGDGFSYQRRDAGGHIQPLRTTAEAAALAALAFDAEQRRAPAAEPARTAETFAVGDLVRVISTQHAEGILTLGAVHRVTRIDPDYRDEPVITVTGVDSCLAKLFERVDPDEVPPGWSKTLWQGVARYRHTREAWVEQPLPKNMHLGDYFARGKWMRGGLHEAMRLARGLERVEQLWEIP